SARKQLEGMGVEVLTGEMVSEVDARGVTLASGQRIEAATVLWAAGVQASSLGAKLGVSLDREGRVEVEPDLSIPCHPVVFILGDLARVPGVPGAAPAAI